MKKKNTHKKLEILMSALYSRGRNNNKGIILFHFSIAF